MTTTQHPVQYLDLLIQHLRRTFPRVMWTRLGPETIEGYARGVHVLIDVASEGIAAARDIMRATAPERHSDGDIRAVLIVNFAGLQEIRDNFHNQLPPPETIVAALTVRALEQLACIHEQASMTAPNIAAALRVDAAATGNTPPQQAAEGSVVDPPVASS
jgi:hypothetical protein